MAALEPKQVDHVARPITLLRFGPIPPAVEQRQQPLLGSGFPMFRPQLLEDWLADQTLLSLPHVVLGMRLDEWLVHELPRLSTPDLLANFLHPAVGDVHHPHRPQRE